MPKLLVRESLPWLGLGIGVIVAVFGVAAAIAGGRGDSVGGLAAVLLWIPIALAALVIVKGMLVIMGELGSREALVAAALSIPIALVAVVLHNVVAVVTGFEEGFFFMVALVGAPLLLIAGIIRAFRPAGPRHRAAPPPAPGTLPREA